MMAITAALLTATQFAACAKNNHYDGLKALSIEQVEQFERVAKVPRAEKHPRLGIAFGGGGVRGFMHLGVLRALDEAGIRADVVTGSSVGALAATLYASGMNYAEIETLTLSASEFDLLDLVISRQGVINGQAYAEWVREATGHRRIKDLPVPLGIAITDLNAGSSLLIVDGDPGEAVQASAAVPGTVVPVQSKGATYIDGGVLTIVPVRFARAMGADIVVAVDIYCGEHPPPKGNAIDTVLKTFRLQSCLISDAEIREADILIRPDFEPDSPISFSQREEAIKAGYRATQAVLPALRKRLNRDGGD